MNRTILCDDGFQEEKIPDFGNKYFNGNGYFGVRGTLEEYGREQMAAVNLSGVYDRHGSAWREPLNAPNPFFVRTQIGGAAYALPQTAPRFHRQSLDLMTGEQGRETVWDTPGGTLQIRSERFCSMADYHLLCMRYTVKTDAAAELTVTAGIDGDVWDINGPHYREVGYAQTDGILHAVGTAGETGLQVAVAQSLSRKFEAEETVFSDGRKILRAISFRAAAGQEYTIDVLAAVYTGADTKDPLTAALRAAASAAAEGYEESRSRNRNRWEQLWSRSRVVIEGDEAAQRAMDDSVYLLHCIAPRYSRSMSIPARGLSGQTYKGAVFWDTEMFMFDFFLFNEPETARTLLRYRIDTLDGARRKARSYGWKGAFYAWESQDGGADACSDYNVTDVFTGRPMRTYFRDKQVHVSAAIVYALRKYLRATGDGSILAQGGAEVILECARFYHSLLVRRAGAEQYEIFDVLGPDEYHERVNNNAYTNRMAQLVFRCAAELIPLLREKFPETYRALDAGMHLEEALRDFTDAAEHLFVPAPDPRTGLIEQFDGYFRLEDATPGVLRERLLDPREYWGGANGVASQTQVVKQADVAMMLALFGRDYKEPELRANRDFYEPRTEHGSSLSACMYALLSCRIGEPDAAYPLFLKSASADLNGGGKQWAGTVYIGGNHPAAAGGAWMTVLQGFCGLEVSADGAPRCRSCLPSGWERVLFYARVRGVLYRFTLTHGETKIERQEG